jgi:PKHD-type hydroxylase
VLIQIPPRTPMGVSLTSYWDNFFSDEEIELLLSQPEWNTQTEGTVFNKSQGYIVSPESRTTDLCWLYPKSEVAHLYVKIANIVAEINSQFYHFDLTGLFEPIQLGTYTSEKKSHYSWHVDAGISSTDAPRKLSVAVLLNDPSEFEGGAFEILDGTGNVEALEIKKGRAWFFPSFVTHRVTPVTKGVRKSAVLWVGGPAFR